MAHWVVLKTTCDKIRDLQTLANQLIGDVPSVVALNKADLSGEWAINDTDRTAISSSAPVCDTSAKNGAGVEHIFQTIAVAMNWTASATPMRPRPLNTVAMMIPPRRA